MKSYQLKAVTGALAGVLSMTGIAGASNVAVGVDVNTPNVRVQVGAPAPPPPPRTVIVERERVVTRERGERHDYGKHKGHYKGHHKKHGKDKHHRD
ncbi:hypothetical protein [Geobacter sp. AOG2]|uniref:hypothetical protein n=1 Tax=Geobacter sp. AOG2 TaxID=1566347 RepID=UPI001CC7C2E1|nr:hypothetical protein [Geobacter sp. AOG2]GFE60128.1 hypothetical protein AOG2_07160 [Geobacter sp. AOG2]